MSDPVDIIEHMFEYGAMQAATTARQRHGGHPTGAAARGAAAPVDHVGAARAALERITALRARIDDMEETRVDTGALPTADALVPLLPGGAIRSGASYSVHESLLLAMTMLQAASASGSWCAVVGIPSFGAEAAAAAGIDLDRLVLVPDPGEQWLTVTAAMVDVAAIVLTRPLGRITPGDTARLSARLRQRGAALVALGSWPGAETSLRVTSSIWRGIGNGYGAITEREATVVASGRRGAGQGVSARMLLPAADGTVAPVVPDAGTLPLRPSSRPGVVRAVPMSTLVSSSRASASAPEPVAVAS
jgi:hypothetical protein